MPVGPSTATKAARRPTEGRDLIRRIIEFPFYNVIKKNFPAFTIIPRRVVKPVNKFYHCSRAGKLSEIAILGVKKVLKVGGTFS